MRDIYLKAQWVMNETQSLIDKNSRKETYSQNVSICDFVEIHFPVEDREVLLTACFDLFLSKLQVH
jgi:hypothetical protein